jgi:hypothetical protein
MLSIALILVLLVVLVATDDAPSRGERNDRAR